MLFTEEKTQAIQRALDTKKRENPMNHKVIGLGICIKESLPAQTTVYKDNFAICDIEELGRMIEELTMLRKAIEEETGIVLEMKHAEHTLQELEIIAKALREYEEAHYMSEDDRWQRTINKLINETGETLAMKGEE